jgi:hypothetical protein
MMFAMFCFIVDLMVIDVMVVVCGDVRRGSGLGVGLAIFALFS